jgi:hypothetical protein
MTGEAAGIAAAYCAKSGIDTFEVPVKTVQQKLRAEGVDLGTPNEVVVR